MNILLVLALVIVSLTFTARAHGAEMDDEWAKAIFGKIAEFGSYFWFLFLALWGGTASYISRLKKSKAPFSIVELVGEWVISGLAGILTALVCDYLGMDFTITAALAGISGHMGGRSIYMLEQWAASRLPNKS